LTHVRLAAVADADVLARLLHDFNTEFDTPTPGVDAISARLHDLLATESTFAVVAESPAVGIALVTLRPNVWYDGPVALLDELYVVPDRRGRGIGSSMLALMESECAVRRVALVEINVDDGDVDAARFYRRHGYSDVDPDSGDRASYFSKELGVSEEAGDR
jgi:GNAT superfamily N-acetyltransferase